MAKKNSDYWQNRFEQLEKASHQEALNTYSQIEESFEQAQREIERNINNWYVRFANNNQITITDAKKMLNASELKELKWDIQEYIKYGKENELNELWIKELENASAKYHISRLEALKIQTQQTMEKLFGNELDEVDKMTSKTYTNNYYHTMFEVQKGFNVGFNIGKIDNNKLSKIVSKPWAVDEKNFSERIWGNKTKLINELHNQLTIMCVQGKSPDNVIKYMSKKFNTSKAQAGNLVMTESAYFSQLAQKDCFKDLDVEEYEIVATLDSHTSEICQEQDGKVYKMSDYQPGVTAPPFHNYCRSTTVPHFNDDYDIKDTRAARDEDGNTYYVENDIKYKDWYQNNVKSDDNLKNVSKSDKINTNKILSLNECQKVIENHGIKFVEEDLKILDNHLLSDNTKQLDELLNKYPAMKEYLKDKTLIFGAENFRDKSTVASFQSGTFSDRLSINLSKSKYSNYDKFIQTETNDIKIFHSMPCADNMLSVYSITHEFGHFIENKLIEEYNKSHLAEFLNMKTRALNTKSISQSVTIVKNWEKKIGNTIAQDIHEIAKANNPNFKLSENLSTYGKTNSMEFFAECFANMECGKINELGEAMKQYLKQRGIT